MAITYTDNGGGAPNGSDLEFTYSFPVIQTEDVKVALNGVTQATTKYTVDNVSNPTKITFNTTNPTSGLQVTSGTNQGAPLTGVRVRVYRETTVGTKILKLYLQPVLLFVLLILTPTKNKH